jgi:hypothetical protein
MADGTILASTLTAHGARVRIAGPQRPYTIEVTLAAAPSRVQLDGHDLPRAAGTLRAPGWRYDPRSGLLQVAVRLASGTVAVVGVLR